MTNCELLVGSAAFWARAEADIAAARSRVLVQAMTFEGDAAGRAVADAIRGATAGDRRVLVDDYSRHVINDRVLAYPFAGGAARREATATRAMFDGLVAAGVGVRVTNPIGANPFYYPVRNHKKLIVADRVAYVGGINFSDHNFAWHDLMLRIEGAAADFLAADFAATWGGTARAADAEIEGARLISLDGRTNAVGFAPVFDLIAGAQTSIELISAYPTFPFVEAFGAAAARGVTVEIFTPLPNNKPVVREYLIREAARRRLTIRLLPYMTHVKSMVIDGRLMVLGSSNFDFASFYVGEEYLAILDDPALIDDFRDRVAAPVRAAVLPDGSYAPPRWRVAKSRATLAIADVIVRRMRTAKRGAVDWR